MKNEEQIRAELRVVEVADPDLTEAQRAGFQSGWTLAAASPSDEMAKDAFALMADAREDDFDEESLGKLLGFVTFHQALTQRLMDALPPPTLASRLRRLISRWDRTCKKASNPC